VVSGVGNASRVHQVWDFPSSLVTASADATYSSFLPALPQPFVLQSDLEVRILSLCIISCYLDVVRLLYCVHHDLDAVCPIHISHVAEDQGRLTAGVLLHLVNARNSFKDLET
jgi:hypothetical protein